MRKKTAFFTLIIGLILILAVFMVINKGGQPLDLTNALAAEIVIEPTQFDSAGVGTTSQFVVKSSTYIDLKIVAENISVEPKIKLSVEEQKGIDKILLIPEKQLEANEIYRFTLDLPGSQPLKWAFQTKGEFKINGTLPIDKSTGVPTNTGIEVAFSHANFVDVDNYFEIFPKTKGRFEKHKKTVVFVPDSLEPGTVYTVKVKKGLKLVDSDVALTEDLVFQFETQDPAQHNQNEARIEFFTNTMEFASLTNPIIPLGYYQANGNESPEVKVSVYKYQGAGAYLQSIQEREKVPFWAYINRSQYLVETKELAEVQSFSTKLKRYDGETFLEFPETLSTGYYLGEVTLGSMVRQIWLQVTDLAVYTSVGKNKTLVWANNLADGKPVVNASVTLLGSEEKAVTDEKGIAEMLTPQIEGTGVYATVKYQDKEAVAVVIPNWISTNSVEMGENGLLPQDFWKYLYLDRGLYKPNDIVHFWGLIKGREKDIKTPQQLTIALTKWQVNQENAVIEEKQVTVEANVFSGDMKLPDLIPGYYNLTVRLDNLIVAQQGFDVQTYTKPAYQIKVVPEKKALLAGDTMEFKVATTGFEETPVPKVALKYNLDKSGELITDAQGQAVLSYTPNYRSDDFGAVQYRYLYLHTNLPESGEITSGTSVIVLNNDININAEGEIRGKKGQINIEIEKLTVDKVNRGDADPWEEDAFVSGKGAGVPVQISIFRQEWDQLEDGEYYDYINKVVVKKYRYKERKVLIDKTSLVTDRNGKVHFDFDAEDKKSYWVQLTAQDSKDNQTKNEIYLSGGTYPQYHDYSWYYLEDEKPDGRKYQEGEQVLLTVKNNESKVTDRLGGFLFYTAQQGIMDYQIQDTGFFETMFTDKDIPNYWVKGVYFDGKTYHETTDYLVALDEKEKALDVKISLDKKEYRPKDKVQVNLDVRDQEGRPVVASVNLSLVDEALFMLNPQQVDTLRSLYGDFLSSGILMTASTHNDPANYFGGGAEQGGEGGSGRQNFQDTAFFETITTGRDGKTTASFTVPDNLTAWRLTYQAVTKELEGASGTTKINVKLPFFVDVVLNDRYLAGDRPIINLRSLGSDLSENTEVNYSVKVTGAEEIYHEKFSAQAYVQVPVSLPSLRSGDYQITVTATGSGKRDTLTRSFQVVESYMTQEKVDYDILTDQSKIEVSTKKPVTLTFADANRSQYLSALLSLAYVEGSRIEQKLVPQIAVELLKANYAKFEHHPLVTDWDLSPYQTPDGGIAILPYGSSDLEISAKIAPWAKDHFDLKALELYFVNVINNPKESRERGIIALYGLASLGEPVLQEVELVAKEDLTVQERLYLVLSLNQLGNEQPAGKVLKQLLKEYGEVNGPYMQINSGNDKDDLVKVTGLAALAAGRLMFDESNKLHRYVMENQPEDELTYLEQITFLQDNLARLSEGDVGFSYVIEDKKQQIELALGETYSLVLTPEKLNLLTFENIIGEVGLTSIYQGAFTPTSENTLDGASITRDYQVAGKSTRQFLPGDLVEVKVTWNMGEKSLDGVYRITDYLPSGLKLVEKPYNRDLVKNNLGWPVEVDEQKVVFLVSNKGSFHYYARIINQGSFIAENMIIQHVQSGKICSVTASDKVEIK